MFKKTAIFLFAAIAIGAVAQPDAVTVSASAPPKVKPGATITVKVNVSVIQGYHIYGPKVKDIGVPAKLTVAAPKGFASRVNYPATQPYEALEGVVQVYEGKVTIPVILTVPKSAKGKQTVRFNLASQACNDRTCLQPSTDVATVSFMVN